MDADLDFVWERLQVELPARFVVFPDAPAPPRNVRRPNGSEGLVSLRGGPAVVWPPDRTMEEFLDLAASLGVRVIYAEGQRFGEGELGHLRLLAPPVIPGAEDFVQEAHCWEARVYWIRLMWMHEGVEHYWEARADWWEQLRHHAAEVQQQGAPVVVAEHLAQVHELAQALASNADFQRIPTVKKRTEAAPRLLPDLLRIMRARPGGRRLAEDVAREAWRIYQEELVPAEEEEMARQAEGLIAQGLGKQVTAGRLGISPDRLNRIMARYSQKGT
jgi:hypothetical protein